MTRFALGHCAGRDWRSAAEACLAMIEPGAEGAALGFLYVTDSLAGHLREFVGHLRQGTGVEHWVGTVGMGICATGQEYYDEPAIAAMIGGFPRGSFRVFDTVRDDFAAFEAAHAGWAAEHHAQLALVHGDPHNAGIPDLIEGLADRVEGGFLVGGLTSSRSAHLQVADGITGGGLSGVLFGAEVALRTRLTQGCSPIGPQREVTAADRNVVMEIDGRPALDVLREDVGELLARDLARIGGYVFAALPVAGSDTGDYVVRNLVGIDMRQGLIAIGDQVRRGGRLMFCRRDAHAAREDLVRMLEALKRSLDAPPRGGVYISCLGRGANLLGPASAELGLVAEVLGDFPLVGFYANGEISHRRLYGYTGVLTLFL